MSDTPNPGLGAIPSMLDSMEFVKRAWSGFNIPAGFTPTLDVDELDKRITDLRAVEQWLSMNLNMLQASIRGMEIQRSTLVAMQAFGQAVSGSSSAMAQAAQDAREPAAAAPAADAPAAGADSAAPSAGPAAGAAREQPADTAPAGVGGLFGALPLQLPTGTAMVNPAAWWQLLQGQFNQVAHAALSGAGVSSAGEALERTASALAELSARAGVGGTQPGGPSAKPDAAAGGPTAKSASTGKRAPRPAQSAAAAQSASGTRAPRAAKPKTATAAKAASGAAKRSAGTSGKATDTSGDKAAVKRRAPARRSGTDGVPPPARRAIRRRTAGH